MSGTKAGGMKAAAANKANDPDFYRKIGSKGGKLGHTGGFASKSVGIDGLTGPQRARTAGTLGGTISRRKAPTEKAVPVQTPEQKRDSLFSRISRVVSKQV